MSGKALLRHCEFARLCCSGLPVLLYPMIAHIKIAVLPLALEIYLEE